tara:strand:+ start:202 stop:1542 length:1341 start_codon:yes stop_codon:yes gene_type:complete
MNLTKNKKFQYLFFLFVSFISIFNGGNSDILIQINFILSSLLFIFCSSNKNYLSHLKYFIKQNKFSICFFLIFLIYLLFQLVPFPLEILKIFSKEKYDYLNYLKYKNYSSISLSPSKTFFQFLNYFSILIIVLIIKMIFYNIKHVFRFFYFMSLLGAFHACFAIILYLNGNPDILFLKNNYYAYSSTGFFINRTVFSIFLLICLICGLEYLKNIDFTKKRQQQDNFFNKIYVRLFIVFIAVGIITTFSKIGNFLMLITIFFYFINNQLLKKSNNKLFSYTLIFIILFDILIMGYFFGSEKLIQRYLFLDDDFAIDNNPNNITRLEIIQFSYLQIKNFFLFGYGAGGFETLFQLKFEESAPFYANHAHSSLIEFFGEFGFLGFVLFVFSFYKILLNKNNYNFNFVLFLTLIIIILLFDFSLHIPINQILFINLFLINFLLRKISVIQ